MTLIRFADGTSLEVRAELAPKVLGLDDQRNVVIGTGIFDSGEEYLVPLTPCCNASGKGTSNAETGVCCRACYAEVDSYYGGFTFVDVPITA